jgi:hypothetical protein
MEDIMDKLSFNNLVKYSSQHDIGYTPGDCGVNILSKIGIKELADKNFQEIRFICHDLSKAILELKSVGNNFITKKQILKQISDSIFHLKKIENFINHKMQQTDINEELELLSVLSDEITDCNDILEISEQMLEFLLKSDMYVFPIINTPENYLIPQQWLDGDIIELVFFHFGFVVSKSYYGTVDSQNAKITEFKHLTECYKSFTIANLLMPYLSLPHHWVIVSTLCS